MSIKPIPRIQLHPILPEDSPLRTKHVLAFRQDNSRHRLERMFLFVPLHRTILDTLLIQVLEKMHAEIELGIVLLEILPQPYRMLLSVGVVRDLEPLQFLLRLTRGEECVLGYVIAVAKCRLRVHHVAEEVLDWKTLGRELQVAVFALF